MRGSAFETMARKSADKARDEGLWLAHTSPRFVGSVGPAGEASGRLVALGALDFIGDYRGQAVTFDCKSTETRTSFALRLIKPHQALIVRNAHARGAIAFFLLELDAKAKGPAYFALTWPVLEPYWRAWHYPNPLSDDEPPASIPRAVLEAHCPRVTRKGSTLDLCAAISGLLETRNAA